MSSSTVTFYTGYYTGGTPTVLSANPFDVAQDLSTGNLWQYTGGAWVAPSWQTSVTFWLGAAEDVCQRLKSEDTKIPDTIHAYVGTDGEVPPELALTADDLAIKHDVGNYNLSVNVLRKDVTTDTFVDVPFPEGYIVTTEDGDWTVLKNFNKCVGYDYATVSLAWTTTADGQGPQSVDYVTSGAVEEMIESAIGSGSGVSGALISGMPFSTTVADGTLTLSAAYHYYEGGVFSYAGDFQGAQAGIEIKVGEWDANAQGTATLYADDDITLSAGSSLTVSGGAITLQNTYLASDEETVVSNTLSMANDSINMGCNDPELGAWYASFDTQAITLSVNNTTVTIDGGGNAVRIDQPLYLSSSLVLQDSFSNATLEADGLGGVTLNGDIIATQPWVQSQISGISAGITSADAANIASSVISSGGYVDSQYVSTAIAGAGETEGYITSGTAEEVASGYAQSAVSGAIFSGSEIATVVGGYLLTYTSSGGLLVSGGGVALQVSSGGIVASTVTDPEAGNSASVILSGTQIVASTVDSPDGPNYNAQLILSPGAVTIRGALDGPGSSCELAVSSDGMNVTCTDRGSVTFNGRPVLTELVTTTDITTVSVSFAVLEGGTSYIYTQTLSALTVTSITSNCRAEFDFTANANFALTLPASAKCMGVTSFTSGSHYLILVDGARVVTNEYTTGA